MNTTGEDQAELDSRPGSQTTRALALPLLPLSLAVADGAAASSPGEERTADASMETAIVLELSVALLANPPAQLTVIEVANEEGVVTLRGEVDSHQVSRIAEEIAVNHPGVASAINDLEIKPQPAAREAPAETEPREEQEEQ